MSERSKWCAHSGRPVGHIAQGQRVTLAYGDRQVGTVEWIDPQNGMLGVWWDGKPRPSHSIWDATAVENVSLLGAAAERGQG